VSLSQALEAFYRAKRVFYLAEFYAAESKYSEALVLYEHAQSLAQQALDLLDDKDKQEDMKTLSSQAAGM